MAATTRGEFALVCAEFIDPGLNGARRQALVADPVGWWRKWTTLLGNAIRVQTPYSVLGELLALEWILAAGETADWMGPRRQTHDIETPGTSYEVKSTIARYTSIIHVSGQHQLTAPQGRCLKLVHIRFEPGAEPGPGFHTINSVVERLVAAGTDPQYLEGHLERLGFVQGRESRNAPYRILDSSIYDVGPGFPKIVPEAFAGGVVPAGIGKIQYEVDLGVLQGRAFPVVAPEQ